LGLDVTSTDMATIAMLVAMEGLLSADNALVMALMVLGLPKSQHQQALRYGLIGAFALRLMATLLAVYFIQLAWVKLLGGGYLLYLSYSHFAGGADTHDRCSPPAARRWLGLSPLWATVLRVELVNLAFSLDSILVAVAMSPKRWVVITGGILGIVAIRLVVGRLLSLIQRYPSLVDGAFVVIAWVGLKLALEYLHVAGYVGFEVPRWVSLAVVGGILLVSLCAARLTGRIVPADPVAAGLPVPGGPAPSGVDIAGAQ
jgi:YkoY family integral membrane protein